MLFNCVSNKRLFAKIYGEGRVIQKHHTESLTEKITSNVRNFYHNISSISKSFYQTRDSKIFDQSFLMASSVEYVSFFNLQLPNERKRAVNRTYFEVLNIMLLFGRNQ